jgi:hypothetical protein
VTSVDRTAYPGFARVVSARELAEAFTPTDAEIEWARGRTQDRNLTVIDAVIVTNLEREAKPTHDIEHVPHRG